MCIYMYTRERERERDRQTDRQKDRERGGQREGGFPCGDGRSRPIVTPCQRVCKVLFVSIPYTTHAGMWRCYGVWYSCDWMLKDLIGAKRLYYSQSQSSIGNRSACDHQGKHSKTRLNIITNNQENNNRRLKQPIHIGMEQQTTMLAELWCSLS